MKEIIEKPLVNKNFPEKLGYIPSLDGLRAFAVIMVMLMHAHFQLGKNGSMGVDMFFALSGFLITTLLLEENRATNHISLKAFYIRRSFRLFPALYFMLSVISVYALFFTIGGKQEIVLKEIFASSIYMYNICWMWDFKQMILGHTWSLGVEEQFYFIWPLIIILFLRLFSTYKLQITLFFFIPIIWVLKFTNQFPIVNALFYESLFIGCLFALLRWNGKLPNRIPNLITILVFFVLVMVGVFPVPGYDVLFENNGRFIFGVLTMIVILGLVGEPNSKIVKLLSNNIIVFIGKISYALYLWHVPVFRWFFWHSTLPPIISLISKFIVTFILAILSLKLIESRSIKAGRRLCKRLITI
jgi:peptidoglycan/LPS O-acetylase OafA/YrhL